MDEVTAEYPAGLLMPAAELRVRVISNVACKTDLGRVRENNEDKFEFFIPGDDALLAARGQIFVVCDGMGGHAAGQIASELAAKTFIDVYLRHPSADAAEAARAAIAAANRFVLDVSRVVPGRRGMGTTLTALMLVQDQVLVANVGDSRAYRLRDGALEMLTWDHTLVEELVRGGMLTREAAEHHPQKHVLTRAIGVEDTLIPTVEWHDLAVGDCFLLCSDGLSNHVSDERIAEELAGPGLSQAVWNLIAAAMLDGGTDNCTALAIRVDALQPVSG
ncbi:MAG: Stp1/IreP family PP2C-type Ser/Thr phosphatase [Fimbriimonadaceae bacterium]